MVYKTHLTTSLCIAIPILYFTNELSYITLAGVSLGAVLPDIDEDKSFIERRIPIIPTIINSIFGHRGITHSLLAVVCVFLIALITKKPFMFGLFIGYLLHIVEDNFSVSGIRWLLPFKKKQFKIPISYLTYKTGELKEWLIFIVTSIILGFEIYHINIYKLFR
ncbi:metal-dependent hydrolase [Eubacterium multiforme]|uniref:Inner membrane protein n=1 Tax=Eubacterium multiforme TaxID=83339 RepID=A0ABT9UTE0_9FIRM|nr:metal-dependent hydrolase [Eubacterium multiforme]MDQ0149608.1 inner membrane protein [Eubacterium multiforme]